MMYTYKFSNISYRKNSLHSPVLLFVTTTACACVLADILFNLAISLRLRPNFASRIFFSSYTMLKP